MGKMTPFLAKAGLAAAVMLFAATLGPLMWGAWAGFTLVAG
jgi:hypothetical protein